MTRRTGVQAALLLALGLSAMPAVADETTAAPAKAEAKPFAVPFIDDDYPKALAEARTKKLPLFVEAWAPW